MSRQVRRRRALGTERGGPSSGLNGSIWSDPDPRGQGVIGLASLVVFSITLAIAVLPAAGVAQDPSGRRERASRLHALGAAFERAGDAGSAVGYFREAVAVDPRHGPSYEALGKLYLSRGDLSAAREAFSTGLRRAPDHVPLSLGLAETLERLGLPDAALEALRSLSARQRESVDAQLAYARLAEKRGKFSEALSAYRAIIDFFQIDPARADPSIASEARAHRDALLVLVGRLDPVSRVTDCAAATPARAALAGCGRGPSQGGGQD